MVTIIALGLAIAWLGRRTFQAPNENDISRPALEAPSKETPTPTPLPPHFPAEATDTAPIPPHEEVDQSLLSAIERCWNDRRLNDLNPSDQFTVLDLEKIFGRIKKQEVLHQKEELELKSGTRRIIELLLDSAKPNELMAQISEIDEKGVNSVIASLPAAKAQASDFKKWRNESKTIRVERKLGLLFDESLFKGGAAGHATDVDGRVQDFQVRADGKILKCLLGGPEGCECH
ncbi:MAG: hypothetical protein J0L82_04405 [Deltaproteobacteria bacterium]|nr:hypothetical protein [Deltaproteobacteria bacterium]